MKEKLVNQYQISKTLQFSLIPVGKTEENFDRKCLLQEDEQRAKNYKNVKKYIDRYHKVFIERVLSSINDIPSLKEYASLYCNASKDDKEVDLMQSLANKMRQFISKKFKNDDEYKLLFGSDLIEKILPSFIADKDEIEEVKSFSRFSTYFAGFHKNRENLYVSDEKITAISNRCINQNLPRFLNNVKIFNRNRDKISEEIKVLNNDILDLVGKNVEDVFSEDFFQFVLSQSGIDEYNTIIGGYSCSDGTKVQGLNEYINLYNQKLSKDENNNKIPKLVPLYKQILSDRDTFSFSLEMFENDDELIKATTDYIENVLTSLIAKADNIIDRLNEYEASGIFVKSKLVSHISNILFGSWGAVSYGWLKEYENNHIRTLKKSEKYEEEKAKQYKKIKSFSLIDIQVYGNVANIENGNETKTIVKALQEEYKSIKENYVVYKTNFENFVKNFDGKKKLSQNDSAIKVIKDFFDVIKEIENFVGLFAYVGDEKNADDVFYGEMLPIIDVFASFDKLYNMVRNYITKKPYSAEKIKLNFQNPQFLGGWDKNKERDYRSVLLRKKGSYYLAIMDKTNNKIFVNPNNCNEDDYYEKIDYKLLPDPSKTLPHVFFAQKNNDFYQPSTEILRIKEAETFKKGTNFDLKDCHTLIQFYKESLEKNEDWRKFNFVFSPTETYSDISQFFKEVSQQGYSVSFSKIASTYIDRFVESGELYLFEIYSKDFSKNSKGTPNLHTLYFNELFDVKNLKNIVFQLNGGAEMFYRKSSIKEEDKIVHWANHEISNKNPLNEKRTSIFPYDLIKDKRFTSRQFSLHLPITINFRAIGNNRVNEIVRKEIRKSSNQHVIGIDRGERNLLYISVIDGNGKIVEQKSLNIISSDNGYSVDYHSLLDSREKQMDEARKNWGTINNIKDLKAGYLSQAVHEICGLVRKYDAIIAMEDLNSGFKNSRARIGKQVYQKFETMLIEKLNYLADKRENPEKDGGILKGYQLTNKVDGKNVGKQNGIIFYVPAWLTSKIDPTTGFVDLIRPQYKKGESKSFVEKFLDIRFNELENIYEFDLDMSKYDGGSLSYRKKWSICSYGNRIKTFRNPDKNNEFDYKVLDLTESFGKLFEKYKIDTKRDIMSQIMNVGEEDFYREFISLFALTLQMRNSISGDQSPEGDYIVSPIRNNSGVFYDSRKYGIKGNLPCDADGNGAYNIARKALWIVEGLKQNDEENLMKVPTSIKNADWLQYTQSQK